MPTPSVSSHRHTDLNSSSAVATASHPLSSKDTDNAQGRLSSSTASGATELAGLQVRLRAALRQFQDFPTPGVLFEDILPIFQNPDLHDSLLRALEIHIGQTYCQDQKPNVIVGLEARGFLFGPSLALRLGAAFVPVRKKGKLPGPVETAGYQKEYGEDFFQIQKDSIKPGQRVLIVDDIIATGGSASAAGSLVQQLGGTLLGYVFILELDFLKGRQKLNAPVYTLLTSQEQSSA